MTTTAPPRPTSIEPGGIESIPADKRHGSPWQLLATWSAPNLEFATVFVGFIGVAYFGLGFWQAILAVVIGNALGATSHGILSTWGPREGLAQLVLSRTAFGLRGNILPAAINTIMAGLGWFAVNSVSGAFALATLTHMPIWLALLIIVVLEVLLAFVGHDLVQVFERYASIVLGVVFIIATIAIFANPVVGPALGHSAFTFGGFTLTAAAAFGYAAGWNPYASDYTRYLPKTVSRAKTGWAAALGNFVSCTVLMAAGAASALIVAPKNASPTDAFVHGMPGWVAAITLLAIAVGAIAANALNIYSGSMSFLAAGIRIRFSLRRAIIAIGFGILGFLIALVSILTDVTSNYENFLLVIAYWIAPWLGVVLVDRLLRRGTAIAAFIPDRAKYRNPAGIIAFVIAAVVSIVLFSNQVLFTGLVVTATGGASSPIGDLTPLVGFVLAGLLYLLFFRVFRPQVGGPVSEEPDVVIGVDAADEAA
ncbi:cytosine permease [Pseudolysinimonas kribbensis]|uniref:Cytosine permease n=1 Tax=Pseudolysinimonas kribbensis TaxID=433641 RepID=A0ABQ6JYB0_9MICO|nr:cytosine permease [Pseudolysinimonas kribbensis]GMA93233.1 cytosine permease [Pseudolysinimonas kribbensis]GMA97141.1 cytosine permease [Pseudolysinimonas kribbensis]